MYCIIGFYLLELNKQRKLHIEWPEWNNELRQVAAIFFHIPSKYSYPERTQDVRHNDGTQETRIELHLRAPRHILTAAQLIIFCRPNMVWLREIMDRETWSGPGVYQTELHGAWAWPFTLFFRAQCPTGSWCEEPVLSLRPNKLISSLKTRILKCHHFLSVIMCISLVFYTALTNISVIRWLIALW